MMGRPPCCDKSNVKRGLWTSEEDAKMLAYVAKHGIGNWTLVPQKAGLNRCGKSCRLRWTNYLRPDLKHDNFTPDEEQLIIDYHKVIGSRWSLIARKLPGRTDNDVKNYWNTKLKKKLYKMGIDHVTHKPISQILSEYEKVNTNLPNHRNQMESLNFPPNNTSVFTSEPSLITSCLPQPGQVQDNSFPNSINQENFQPNFLPEFSSSTSSSSSCSIAEFLPVDYPVWEEKQESAFQNKEASCSEAACSSSERSFVEAILDRDSEMQLEFPEFLNEYFNY